MDGVFEDEAWKEDLEKSLFENYGLIPKYYEDLGDGIYQVYMEVGGEVVLLVKVDSETGDYQVIGWRTLMYCEIKKQDKCSWKGIYCGKE